MSILSRSSSTYRHSSVPTKDDPQVSIILNHKMTLYAYPGKGCLLNGVVQLVSEKDIATRSVEIQFAELEYFEFGVPRMNKLLYAKATLLYSAKLHKEEEHHLPFSFKLPDNLHTTVFTRYNCSRYELEAVVRLRRGLKTITTTQTLDIAFYAIPHEIALTRDAPVPLSCQHSHDWAEVSVEFESEYMCAQKTGKAKLRIEPQQSSIQYYYAGVSGQFTEYIEYVRADGKVMYKDSPRLIASIDNIDPDWYEPQPLLVGQTIEVSFEFVLPSSVTTTLASLRKNWATATMPANIPDPMDRVKAYVYYDVENTHVKIKHTVEYKIEFWNAYQESVFVTGAAPIKVILPLTHLE
ncbi:hypothetical protein GGI05_000502 [Coemansia sp. RSA 2603]|nr:hypothetical protein GGI05_000502 [Coemansia sp. RSA 2603]